METFSALLAICAGNSPVTGEFPAQRPVTRSFDVFFDLCLNEGFSKLSWGWWFETSSRPLWRHSNDLNIWWSTRPQCGYIYWCELSTYFHRGCKVASRDKFDGYQITAKHNKYKHNKLSKLRFTLLLQSKTTFHIPESKLNLSVKTLTRFMGNLLSSLWQIYSDWFKELLVKYLNLYVQWA